MATTYRSMPYADFLSRVTYASSDKNYTMKIQTKEVVLLLSKNKQEKRLKCLLLLILVFKRVLDTGN